jgi:hypothetical protein
MTKKWKTRFLIFCLLAGIHQPARAAVWYLVEDISTGKKFYSAEKTEIHLTVMRHQIAAFKMTGYYLRRDDNPSIITLNRYYYDSNYDLPAYVENWVDQKDTLDQQRMGQMENTFYIRPIDVSTTGLDSFKVEATIRYGLSPFVTLDAGRLTVYVKVVDPDHAPPEIVPEKPFTAGTVNTLFWIPASGASVQDVYCFDKTDRSNLQKSIQRLYRSSGSDTLQAVFEGLEEGRSYGYFVKSVFGSKADATVLYSDFTYSTQDKTPPLPVESVQAVLAPGGQVVLLSWNTVTDGGSGTALYRIYRSENSGPEVLLDSLAAYSPQPESMTYEDRIHPGVSTYYRVRGVDGVGNEGDGQRTNSVISGTGVSNPQPNPGGSGDVLGPSALPSRPFHKGTADTLRVPLIGLEKQLRFQSVRDSAGFFNSPPPVGGRVFDSGWISMDQVQRNPSNYEEALFVFEYTSAGQYPKNFVNGHTYIRRTIRKYLVTSDTLALGETVPDCFPPDDIRNLKIDAAIVDPDFQTPSNGYTKWQFLLGWEAAFDGASGLKRYRIFRKIEGLDSSFQEVPLPANYVQTTYVDLLSGIPAQVNQNANVLYRIASEDFAGNERSVTESNWEVRDRALGGPMLVFSDMVSSEVSPVGADTLFVRGERVTLKLARFDLSPVSRFSVSVNGRESTHANTGLDTLQIVLPDDEVSVIKIRAVYPANRSSIWSNAKTLIRALQIPPLGIEAWNDTLYWGGNIHLKWRKSSLDVKRYEIFRWSPTEAAHAVGLMVSLKDTLQWTDYYGLDELRNAPGDTLETYQKYSYAVRKINLFDDATTPSDSVSSYCNRAPKIVAHRILTENERFTVKIHWSRPEPNLFPSDFTTVIQVYSDSTRQAVEIDTVSDDDTFFTYRNVQPGHNTIFRILEILNRDDQNRRSAWSQPYTVSFKKLGMNVLAQPKGKIFIHWDTSIVDSFRVSEFNLTRIAGPDTFKTVLSNMLSSYMDSSIVLSHGSTYSYHVYALDSLGQVVAANSAEEVCDTGSAYIPDVVPFTMRYFNSDSIGVFWVWKDIRGNPVQNTTRGAVFCRLQVSVSRTFPSDTSQTRTVGPFPADPENRTMRVRIPTLGNRENENLYFRITATDSWGNPLEKLWSTDFYPIRVVVYDPVPPRPMNHIDFVSAEAYYAMPDSVIHTLQWTGEGVERPENPSLEIWDRLVGNVAFYEVWRTAESGSETLVARKTVQRAVEPYVLQDTTKNLNYRYKAVTVDSAGNRTIGVWNPLPEYLSTPEPPVPIHKKGCKIRRLENRGESVQYFVEIAMNKKHFRLAYEMDGSAFRDSLLCRSGWITDSTFTCGTGWGSIETDTTWFRVKARVVTGARSTESGWSALDVFVPTTNPNPGQKQDARTDLPRDFSLRQNYPNPFNAGTTLSYDLSEPATVALTVYNVMGSRTATLVQAVQEAGSHTVFWNGENESGLQVASGIYFGILNIRSEATGQTVQKRIKMAMVR